MKRILIFQIILLLFSCLSSQDIKKTNVFANQLMQEGEYYRAITEYKRINSYFPNNNGYTQNLINIAKCYMLADHKIEAINSYKNVLNFEPNNEEAIFSIITTYTQLSYFYESNNEIENHLHKFKEENKDKLLIYSSLNYIHLGKYNEAMKRLDSIENVLYQKKSKEFKKTILSNTPLMFKNKSTAIITGILIPGGGYFYTKRYQTGFASLVVNSLLFYMTYDCFQNDKKGLGVMSGVFFTSFYLGSIYGSIQIVDNYNKEIQINFIKKFKF
ncbi:MAG: hypothetical protein U9P73_02850 [Candidatus Cloacimonadota bacterium]|nr:hypothetical protein [Candidatus Cloacimonadota bacterium]